jgi:hypothetical protein
VAIIGVNQTGSKAPNLLHWSTNPPRLPAAGPKLGGGIWGGRLVGAPRGGGAGYRLNRPPIRQSGRQRPTHIATFLSVRSVVGIREGGGEWGSQLHVLVYHVGHERFRSSPQIELYSSEGGLIGVDKM